MLFSGLNVTIGQKLNDILGWLMVIVLMPLPGLQNFLGGSLDPQSIFFRLIACALVMWTLRLTAPYIPGIFLIVGFLGFNIAPPSSILHGFASPLFFLSLCLFMIAGCIISSRLYERFAEWSLRFLPLTSFWMFFAVYIMGLFMTLTVPFLEGRLKVIQTTCRPWAAYLSIRTSSSQLDLFIMAFYQSILLFSPIFLTSSIYNLITLGFFRLQDQERFGWLSWASNAFVPFLVLWGGIVVFLWYASFQGKLSVQRDKNLIHIGLLGRLRSNEKSALITAFIMILGFLTSDLHQLQSPVWAGVIMLFLFTSRSFTYEQIQKDVDWTALIFTGCLGGISLVADTVDATDVMTTVAMFSSMASSSQEVFIILLSLTLSLSRFLLPNRIVVVLGAMGLIPFAYSTTIHPWVIAFVVLTSATSTWKIHEPMGLGSLFESFPSQQQWNTIHLKRWLWYFNVLRVLAIMTALPFWRAQGLL